VGSTREGYLTAQGRNESQETHLEDVFGGGQPATASPTGETEDAGTLNEEMGLPDLIAPEDDSDTEGDDEVLPHVARCREPPDNPTLPEDIEPPKQQQKQWRPDGEPLSADDYAFGVMFSSLHYVRRHFTNLVVKGLISLTEAREQTARYNDLFRKRGRMSFCTRFEVRTCAICIPQRDWRFLRKKRSRP
jgi:hypothetical protein